MARSLHFFLMICVVVSVALAASETIRLGGTGLGLFDRFNEAAHVLVHGQTTGELLAAREKTGDSDTARPEGDLEINYDK